MVMSSRSLGWFLGSLLVVSWAIQGAALYFVGDAQSDGMTPWLVAMMFIPTIWSLSYLAVFNRSAWRLIALRLGNSTYLLLAALIPALLVLCVLGIVEGAGWASSSFFNFDQAGVNVLRGPWILGKGFQNWGIFAANLVSTTLLFACLNGLVAIGEEFGWRGVLQHHLIARFGFLGGVTGLGFVWAIWHAPMNLAGYNFSEMPILGALILSPIELISVSFIMAWITLRAKSFWPAVLMHGSGNGVEEGIMSSLRLGAGVHPMTGELVQIGVTVAIAVTCLILTLRRSQHPDEQLITSKKAVVQ